MDRISPGHEVVYCVKCDGMIAKTLPCYCKIIDGHIHYRCAACAGYPDTKNKETAREEVARHLRIAMIILNKDGRHGGKEGHYFADDIPVIEVAKMLQQAEEKRNG